MQNAVTKEYKQDRVSHWAPVDKNMEAGSQRVKQKNRFVAVLETKVAGFAELDHDGHMDSFYCHHALQRRGLVSAVLNAVAKEPRSLNLPERYAVVSLTGIAFFTSRGSRIQKQIVNAVCNAPAEPFHVRKSLCDGFQPVPNT